MRLNKHHAGVRTSILMMNPLPILAQAYRTLVKEQKHKEISLLSESSNETMEFLADRRRFDNNRNAGNNGYSRNSYQSRNINDGGRGVTV